MGTSGQNVASRTQDKACGGCDFEGPVDVIVDPELHEAFWECPECPRTHTEALHD